MLTNYGPLGLIWFDRGIDTPQQAAEFVNLVRTLQPKCLVNGRVGNYGQELMGDYQDMGDNGMPTGGLDEYWETPQTLNTTWGYSKFDQEWKTPGERDSPPGGDREQGRELPAEHRADGRRHRFRRRALRCFGRSARGWKRTARASTGLRPALVEFPWGRCTVKGQNVYLHVFSWPADGTLRVSGLSNDVRAAYRLGDPSRKLAVNTRQRSDFDFARTGQAAR